MGRAVDFTITPQRDMGSPIGELWTDCHPEDAEQWAVSVSDGEGRVVVGDYTTKAEAQAFVSEAITYRPGDVFQSHAATLADEDAGWFVVIDTHDFTVNGPWGEAEARDHGATFA